ncbi:MAG: hypothetical protein EBZ48_00490 [Proteobacteria bacterium]|nr:hypothetical protein [Pseudomonadota bacterium]
MRESAPVRIEKLDRGEYDLLILSMDGLLAVGQATRASQVLSIEEMMPALGQGFGAAETREDNADVIAVLNSISNPESIRCLRAEWALMRALPVTCMTPLGGICVPNSAGGLTFTACMYGPEGERVSVTHHLAQEESPEALGQRVARSLHELGAKDLAARWGGRENGLSQDAC